MPSKEPKERGIKLFSVEEANQLIPQVQTFLHQLRARRLKVHRLEEKKAVEELSWLQPNGTVSPKAQAEVDRINIELENEARIFAQELEALNALGGQLKDLEEGLVDFFTARGGDLACLCWRDGEREIGYWHDLDSGFGGRRPLAEL